jgi:hypothetical protein
VHGAHRLAGDEFTALGEDESAVDLGCLLFQGLCLPAGVLAAEVRVKDLRTRFEGYELPTA